jgi:hypothetical protein
VRKVDGAPLAVVELFSSGLEKFPGLGEYPIASEPEVLTRVAGVPEMEPPAKVQEKPFSGAASVVGIADVIPAETATPLFNTSRLVHLRISPLPYSRIIAC